MQYLLPKEGNAVELVTAAAMHLGVPYELRVAIHTDDPRLSLIIEALAGEAYSMAPWLENLPTLLGSTSDAQPEKSDTQVVIKVDSSADHLDDVVQRLAEKVVESAAPIAPIIVRPGKRFKAKKEKPEKRPLPLCEICNQRPTTSLHAKICDNPDCKAKRQARYMQEARDRLKGKAVHEIVPVQALSEGLERGLDRMLDGINSELEPEPNPFPYPAGVMEAPAVESPLPVNTMGAIPIQVFQPPAGPPLLELRTAPESWSQAEPWWVISGHQKGMTMTSKLMRERVKNGTLEPGTILRNIWRGEYLVQAASADHPRRVVQVQPASRSSAVAGPAT